MKTVWFAAIAMLASTAAAAQSTIYKHVDESGRITYSNKPMKGGTVVDLEPLTTIPGQPGPAPTAQSPSPAKAMPARLVVTDKPAASEKPEIRQAAVVTPLPRTTLAAAEPVAPRREDPRRKELADELARTEQALATTRASLSQEQQNPTLVTAVRAAQQAVDPSPSQLAQMRENIERASGRIRGLQATIAEHERTLDSLRLELASLK